MFRFMHQILHCLITLCTSSKLFFFPSLQLWFRKTVTLATPSEEPVTVSMLYLSSDLNVILLYLEIHLTLQTLSNSEAVCHLMKLDSGGLRSWETWTKLPWADAQPHNKIKAMDETFWFGRKSKSKDRSLEHLRRSAANHVEVWLCVQGSNAQH